MGVGGLRETVKKENHDENLFQITLNEVLKCCKKLYLLILELARQTHDVVSTPIRRLYEVETPLFRTLLNCTLIKVMFLQSFDVVT